MQYQPPDQVHEFKLSTKDERKRHDQLYAANMIHSMDCLIDYMDRSSDYMYDEDDTIDYQVETLKEMRRELLRKFYEFLETTQD